jgi:small subunit ribosomal protein S3
MGHKVHPIGLRIGSHETWRSRWYDEKNFAQLLVEDVKIREAVMKHYRDAGISRIEIERQGTNTSVTVYTSRPGMVIGRDGQRVEEVRQLLEALSGKRVRLTVGEIYQPELDARLVARNIADQIERRVAFRRAIRQGAMRTMQAGAKGVKITVAGRLGGREIARRETVHQGRMPLHTLRADIDFAHEEARTLLGRIGVKVWIYRGDVLPSAEAAA